MDTAVRRIAMKIEGQIRGESARDRARAMAYVVAALLDEMAPTERQVERATRVFANAVVDAREDLRGQ